MSDNMGDESISKGRVNEWEVVALTESTYAAAPGPNQVNADTPSGGFIDSGSDSSSALFLSGHFGVAQSTHETLPLEPEKKMNRDEAVSEPNIFEDESGGKFAKKDDENLHIAGLLSDEFHDSSKLNEKGNILSFYDSGFGDAGSPDFIVKEHNLYGETTASISSVCSEGSGISEHPESPKQPLIPQTPVETDKNDELPPDLASESWWGRRGISLYELVKNADPFWSFIAAATVVGLIIIGHRWRQEKPDVHLTSRIVSNRQGPIWMVSPITHLKEANWDDKHAPHIKFASLVQN